jgi:superoxide dismutase, Fe-Mn family
MPFSLAELPYAADALVPFVSAETMEIHHGRHHRAYVDKLNELVPGSEFAELDLDELVKQSFGKDDVIFNNAGQHWNHAFFWPSLKIQKTSMPSVLERQIIDNFGSIEKFKTNFVSTGIAQFGSGWVWLVQDSNGRLAITKTSNALNPLVNHQRPLLGCDVWEHAYYIDYRNRRADYLKAFIDQLVDWELVAHRLGA